MSALHIVLEEARQCRICESALPLGPRPIVQAEGTAKILIVGQAPGRRVHESGVPWDDPSGHRLRDWLGVDRETFYDPRIFAIVPMGFCYPGTGKSGDLPPRRECAPQWHSKILDELGQVELTLLLSQYAQSYYLGPDRKKNLTETVRAFGDYAPGFLPLPHPSPRNNRWLKKNPWFEADLLPRLKARISELVS